MKDGWYFEATVLEDKQVQGELRGVVWMCRFERKVFPVAKRSMYSTQAQFPNREDPSQKQRCLSAIYLDTTYSMIKGALSSQNTLYLLEEQEFPTG